MPKQSMPTLAFVDIETTGSHFERDRITELAIISYGPQGLQRWSRLIDPGQNIPEHIQQLTGITPDMVTGQGLFAHHAKDILEQLQGKIFVAHNARFDYGFIKASMKRAGYDFTAKVLCTVKLSRRLFPQQDRHNLDTLIRVHDLHVEDRHRAMTDADLLLQFWQKIQERWSDEELLSHVDALLQRPAVPSHLDADLLDEIPEQPGVYIFYAEDRFPLYIGKSRSLRTRVLSHFQNTQDRKALKLSMQVRDLDWIQTAGELGALLLEARLIKERLPSLNIQLRRSRELCSWQLVESEDGYLQPVLVNAEQIDWGVQEDLYGVFASRKEALSMLSYIAKEHDFCELRLGLEKPPKKSKKDLSGSSFTSASPCFAYQLKRCRGACVGAEKALVFNWRLREAMASWHLKTWPYPGPIGIREEQDVHVVDRWRYLGSAANESEIEELLLAGEPEFDLDIYKILKKHLGKANKQNIIDLSTWRMTTSS